MYRKFSVCFVLMLTLCIMAGCGKTEKRSGITGTVTLDGSPVANAQITFSPKGGNTANEVYGSTDEKGIYTLRGVIGGEKKGVPAGSYAVIIFKRESVDSGKTQPDIYPDANGKSKMVPVMIEKDLLPAIYGKVNTTPLTATVPEGNATIDFKLVSDGSKAPAPAPVPAAAKPEEAKKPEAK